jgi:cytochrome c peroxidase
MAGVRTTSIGINGQASRRRPPTLFNRAYGRAFFWDGRESTLEAQALRPITSPTEMGANVNEVVKKLSGHPDYSRLFREAFGAEVSADRLTMVLASFERVLLSGDTPVDRFRAGEVGALSASSRHGLWLYESRAGCWRCHGGPNFTDESFHNTGIGWGRQPNDWGRYEITAQEADRGRFKTPTFRGLAATAPYMHDGSMATLDEVVAFYNRGGNRNPHLDPLLEPLDLSPSDLADLVAFLRSLSTMDRAPTP